ncbi:MotA/TolQ/ExbB proton channel family protein [Singulisphaera sp. PoT]|uniref:MotA/TolQ/ExbB proton channel family protein n=1 Tax=Singulisphaera sp. PoT TaxID=3411797 RepID=UPI003BF49BD6
MASGAHRTSRLAYPGTLAMLGLALAFPIALMVFNPTLMFERGWEQYVGTGIYFWAVLTLARELSWLWKNESAFEEAPALLKGLAAKKNTAGNLAAAPAKAETDDRRLLPGRIRQLSGYVEEARSPSVAQLMELNREGSALDQEHAAGRFTLTRYILYLLPVIGFIGTVEGISKALMNISKVLPMVKDLDGFMNNLTSVTSALQVAFDSTLLALFLSAALMLVQTLVYRRSEDLLARIDRWVVEQVLPKFGRDDSTGAGLATAIATQLEKLRVELAALIEPAAKAFESQTSRWTEALVGPIEQFSKSVDRLPMSMAAFQRGAEAIAAIGGDLESLGMATESIHRGSSALVRIESNLANQAVPAEHFDEIKQGINRTCMAIESLSSSWTSAYERSSRTTQEQLARTLNSLKDALDLLNVSMEQGNALYRNIVKKMFDERAAGQGNDSIRAA